MHFHVGTFIHFDVDIYTSEKVYKEFMLYTMARNLNKYHRFITGKIQKFEGKTAETVA